MDALPRIVSVVDTRDFVEEGDRVVRIPGTGNDRPCDRCGRSHEIHVTVEHADGRTMVVGLGCAGRSDADGRKVVASLTGLAKLRAQLAGAERRAARWAELVELVDAETVPEIVKLDTAESGNYWLGTADGTRLALVHTWADLAEREQCARSSWRSNRLRALAGADHYRMAHAGEAVADLTARVAKAERKLAAVIAAA